MSAIDAFCGAVANMQRAYKLADRAVLADIETEGVPHQCDGATWIDIEAMLSPQEHAPEVLDQNTEALAYAAERGLIFVHPARRHLVRIVRRCGRCATD